MFLSLGFLFELFEAVNYFRKKIYLGLPVNCFYILNLLTTY